MDCGDPITIGMPFRDQSVSGLGDPSPLGRIAKARYHLAAIGEIGVERDIVLIRSQDVIVSTPQQDLAGSGSRRVKVTGGDTF